jgi:hypothetical protein
MADPRVVNLLNALRIGNTRSGAAAYAQVHRDTLYDWLRNPTFSDALEKAEADAKMAAIANIHQAGRKSWQASAWYLERRYADEFGRRERVDVEIVARREADRIAQKLGLDADDLLERAERLVREGGE